MNKKILNVTFATVAGVCVGALAYRCGKLKKKLDTTSVIVNDMFDVVHTCATFHTGSAVADLSNNVNVEKANVVASLFNTMEQRNRYAMDMLNPMFKSWSGMRMALIMPEEKKSHCDCDCGCSCCDGEEKTYFDEELDVDDEEVPTNEGE